MECYFSIDDFYEGLKIGHEIEFVFDGGMYFISPDYEFNSKLNLGIDDGAKFVLYQCANRYDNNAEIILTGTYDEIVSFPLKDKMTIKTDYDKFQLHCML